MDYYETYTCIILNESIEPLKVFFAALYKLEAQLRPKLGTQEHLLDEYLHTLFKASQIINHQSVSKGLDASLELYSLYTGISNGETQSEDNSFYPRVKYYVENCPVVYRGEHPRSEIYPPGLASEYLKFATSRYFYKVKAELFNDFFTSDAIENQHRRICTILKEDDYINELNILFRQQFLLTTIMSAFLHGLTCDLLSQPTEQDTETCRQIFQQIIGAETSLNEQEMLEDKAI